MSLAPTSTSTNPLQSVTPPQVDAPKQQPQTPPPVQVKSDGEARAAQSSLVDTLKTDLKINDLAAKNVLTRDGMSTVLGRASKYANVKDTMMRVTYRMVNRLKPPEADFGSNHKAVIRLADQYETLKKNGASEDQLRPLLLQMKDKLEDMHYKHEARNTLAGRDSDNTPANAHRLKLSEFIQHEIDTLPSSHAGKAQELKQQYQNLSPTTPRSTKEKIASEIIDHINGADPHGKDDALQSLKGVMQKDLARFGKDGIITGAVSRFGVTGELPGKDGGFVKLKHAHTRVQGGMDVVHSEAHQKKIESDPERQMQQSGVNMEIEFFDRSQLKPVKTDERTGLEHAKAQYKKDSQGDDHVLASPAQFPKGHTTPLSEPDATSITKTLTGSDFDGFARDLGKALTENNTGLAQQWAEGLGSVISKEIAGSDKDAQVAFATSNGAKLKEELYQKLASQPGADPALFGTSYKDAPQEIKDFLDATFKAAVTNLPNRQVDADTLTLDGVTYKRVSLLGEGGFGAAYLYEGDRNGVKEKIVVKEPLNTVFRGKNAEARRDAQFNMISQEARAAYLASKNEPDNIVGFRGAVQSAEGHILIAMDFAPNGGVDRAAQKIIDAEKQGLISPQTANLMRITLLKDMAVGLKHLQERLGISHLDLKPGNAFIDAEGNAQLADFGLTDLRGDGTHDKPLADNPVYLAPEVAVGGVWKSRALSETAAGLKELSILADKFTNNAVDEVPEFINKSLLPFLENHETWFGKDPSLSLDYSSIKTRLETIRLLSASPITPRDDAQIESLARDLVNDLKPVFEQHEKVASALSSDYQVTTKADTWALGIAALEIFTGGSLLQADFAAEYQSMLAAYAKGDDSRYDTFDFGSHGEAFVRHGTDGGSGTGAGALGRLLNQMLARNPDDRPSITDILSHSLFNEPGVGSEDVRKLIALVTKPIPDDATPEQIKATQEQIKAASDNLGV